MVELEAWRVADPLTQFVTGLLDSPYAANEPAWTGTAQELLDKLWAQPGGERPSAGLASQRV